MEGLGTEVGNKEFSLYPFFKGHVFTFLTFSQKAWISEECNKDMKLASREPNDFIASKCLTAPENVKIFQLLQEWTIL
jgi:hypothetical protein